VCTSRHRRLHAGAADARLCPPRPGVRLRHRRDGPGPRSDTTSQHLHHRRGDAADPTRRAAADRTAGSAGLDPRHRQGGPDRDRPASRRGPADHAPGPAWVHLGVGGHGQATLEGSRPVRRARDQRRTTPDLPGQGGAQQRVPDDPERPGQHRSLADTDLDRRVLRHRA
ncbi:MAG: hypothetical protein AVDCRST_MAG60-931, partial [uncultured Nocardioides sp.]